MKTKKYRMRITPSDFELFLKVFKVVYNDLNELIKKHKVIDVRIENEVVRFNDFPLNFDLEHNKVIRLLLNMHFIIQKHGHLFKTQESKELDEEDWLVEYTKFRNAIITSQKGKKINSSFWG